MALSEAEEIIFKERILLMGSWRYPITKVELQKLVKNYLASRGRTVSVFKENKPGRDWTKAFLTRRQDVLTVRTANMLKRSSLLYIDGYHTNWNLVQPVLLSTNFFFYF